MIFKKASNKCHSWQCRKSFMVFRCFQKKLVPFDRHAVFGCTLNRYYSDWTGRINTVLIIYYNTTVVPRGNRQQIRLQVLHLLFFSWEKNPSKPLQLFLALQGLIYCLNSGLYSGLSHSCAQQRVAKHTDGHFAFLAILLKLPFYL